MKQLLEKQLKSMSSIALKEYDNLDNVGVLGGQSGVALFLFYYAQYFNDDSYYDAAVEIISSCMDKINNGYSFSTYCNGIAGFGWVVQHLSDEDFIRLNVDDLLVGFDDFLLEQMTLDVSHSNYDFLHGSLGYAYYFLKRYNSSHDESLKNTYQEYLNGFLRKLSQDALYDDKKIRWESILDNKKGIKGYNFGLSHGISSIVNFLSRLHKIDFFRNTTKELLVGGVNYILEYRDNSGHHQSQFPNWIVDENLSYNSRLAWCYGDLGIGLSLMHAGVSLNDLELQQKALDIVKFTIKRKSNKETMVVDAGFCHGSFGNAHIYNYFNRNFPKNGFDQSIDFWISDGLSKSFSTSNDADYKQWDMHNNTWIFKVNLLEGISGIGLTMIDYLSSNKNTWDECLMLG